MVFQVVIIARDGGFPSLTSEASAYIEINVIRNNAAPVFSNDDNIIVTIKGDARRGTNIATLSATDEDDEVSVVSCLQTLEFTYFVSVFYNYFYGKEIIIMMHILLQNTYGTITYTITGVNTGPTFFEVDPEEGHITVKSGLDDDTETEYIVSINKQKFDIYGQWIV